MITLRIRGLYAAALTSLFRHYAHVCEMVQPDDEIQAHVHQAWRMDSPDVTIDDQPEARGPRDTLRVAGPADAVEQVLQLLQERCFDAFVRRESSQIGATYMGLVGAVSRVRRRAVVYMGEQRAGILPLRYDDRELRVGSYIPVRIEALSTEGDTRPQLSTVITVAGQYAVLTSAQGVKLSKQIGDTATRERLQGLGEAQATGGWGILWRTAAQHAGETSLVQEITHLTQAAHDLQARIAAATTVTVNRLMSASDPAAETLPGDWLLRRLAGAGEQPLPGLGVQDDLGVGVVRSVLRPRPFDGHLVARLQREPGPPEPHQPVRARQLEAPVRHLARRVLHVDINPGMRVRPLQLRDSARQLHRLVRVELRRKRVMRDHRPPGQEERDPDYDNRSLHRHGHTSA